MKLFKFLFLALSIGVFVACDDTKKSDDNNTENNTENKDPKESAAAKYTIQAEAAQVMWMASKDEGAHSGTFAMTTGNLDVSDAGITGGSATIDITSLAVTDGTPEDMAAKLSGHLGSEDFFNSAAFPDATVKITGSSKYAGAGETAPEGLPDAMAGMFIAAPTHTINAKLTVKGEEKDISFPAEISMGDGTLKARAFITFDRRAYGLRFMSDTEAKVHANIHVALGFTATK